MADEKKFKLRLETEGDDSGAKKVEQALDKTAAAAGRVEGAGQETGDGLAQAATEVDWMEERLAEAKERIREANEELDRENARLDSGNGLIRARLGIYAAVAAVAGKASNFARRELEELREYNAEAADELEASWSGAFLSILNPANAVRDVIDSMLEPMREAKQLAIESMEAAEEAIQEMEAFARAEGQLDFANWQSGLERVAALQSRVQASTRAGMALEQQRADNDLLLTEQRIEAMTRLIAVMEAAGRITPKEADARRAALRDEGVDATRAKAAGDISREQAAAAQQLSDAAQDLSLAADNLEKAEAKRQRLETQVARTNTELSRGATLEGQPLSSGDESRLRASLERAEGELAAVDRSIASFEGQVAAANEQVNNLQARTEALKASLSEEGAAQQAIADIEDLVQDREQQLSEGAGEAARRVAEFLDVATQDGAQLTATAEQAKATVAEIIADAVVSVEEIGRLRPAIEALAAGSTAQVDAVSNALSTATQAINAQSLKIRQQDTRLLEIENQIRRQSQLNR